MSSDFNVNIKGDKLVEKYLNQFPKTAEKAARLTVNDTLRKARTMIKREIMREVNFTSSYLDGSSSRGRRLDTRLAKKDELSGSVVGRFEPTSLARFVTGWETQPYQTRKGSRRVAAKVKVGRSTKTIPRKPQKGKSAFIMQLKNGNQGLAIRLPKGQRPDSRAAKKIFSDAYGATYLLYGPSVQQVMLNRANKGVLRDLQPKIAKYMNTEFQRQFGRLNNG